MTSLGDLFGRAPRRSLGPEDAFQRVNDDVVKAARAVKEIQRTEGFELLMELIRSRKREIGQMALEDESKPKDWWRGYNAGVGSLDEMLQVILERADELEQETMAEEGARSQMKTSGGDFSL